MANAFQRSAFQHPSFQGGGAVPIQTPVGGRRKRQIKLRIKVGDEIFDVYDEAEAQRLLAQLRASAEQTAAAAAQKAVAKAEKAKTPAAKERALIPHPPQITLVAPDRSGELAQRIQAQVDAARAAVEATYRRILIEAWARAEQDEDDITMLLLS